MNKYLRVKLRAKGQMTIPARVMEDTEIEVGDLLDVTYNEAFGWIEFRRIAGTSDPGDPPQPSAPQSDEPSGARGASFQESERAS